MPKLLSPRTHGVLDYVTVVLFALAPTLLRLNEGATMVCYVLAGVHLAMTLATAFPLGIARLIPFPLHGKVEAVVAVALVALGMLAFRGDERAVFIGMGVVIAAVWATTDYRAA